MLTINTETMPPLADNDLISQLPTELKLRILRFLDVPGVSAIRLMSCSWAETGAELLLKAGLIVPNHRAITRLLKASSRPLIGKGIKTLILYVGQANRERLLDTLEDIGCCEHKQDVVWEKIEQGVPKGTFVDHLNTWALERLFKRLPRLDYLVIKSTSYPFLHPPGQNIPSLVDPVFAGCFDLLVTRQRCTAILKAVNSFPTPLRKLVLDPLPLSTFFLWSTENPKKSEEITKAIEQGLSQIEDLSIHLENSDMVLPDDENSLDAAIKSFEHFFRSMPRLRSIQLHWTEIDETSSTFMRSFLKNKWAKLENLAFSSAPSMWADFWDFLLPHKTTLKRLSIIGDMVLDLSLAENWGTLDWREVLTDMRVNLRLECFEIQLIPSDVKLYHSGSCYDGSESPDDAWGKLAVDPTNPYTPTALLEMFVQGEIPWPMLDPVIGWTYDDHPQWNVNPDRLLHNWEDIEHWEDTCNTKVTGAVVDSGETMGFEVDESVDMVAPLQDDDSFFMDFGSDDDEDSDGEGDNGDN